MENGIKTKTISFEKKTAAIFSLKNHALKLCVHPKIHPRNEKRLVIFRLSDGRIVAPGSQ